MTQTMYFVLDGILLLWIIAASIGDVLTTNKFLALGIRESIPFSSWLMAWFGKWYWVPNFAIRGAFVYAVLVNVPGWKGLVVLSFIGLMFSYAVWHNLRTIARFEAKAAGN